MGLLDFEEGTCWWSASGQSHTVIYRSSFEWKLWEARRLELDELREEQAQECEIEKELVMTEDRHLEGSAALAVASGDFNHAATCLEGRFKLRQQYRSFRQMPAEWRTWTPELDLAYFPEARHGFDFFAKHDFRPQRFSSFAHWFSYRSIAPADEKLRQTRLIYEKAMELFPREGGLAKDACLFFRRVGNYKLAIETCNSAISRGLTDGTKSGFVGRLKRLEAEMVRGGESSRY